jgi:flagellar basal body-associated protein FliL
MLFAKGARSVGWILRFVRRHPLVIAVSLLLAGEGVMMSFYFAPPSPKATADDSAQPASAERIEITAGDYKVRNHQIPGDDYVLKFSVCLTTGSEKHEELAQRYKDHEQRVREAIAIVARRANGEVLSETTLATLKRRFRVAVADAMAIKSDREFDILLPDFLMQKG